MILFTIPPTTQSIPWNPSISPATWASASATRSNMCCVRRTRAARKIAARRSSTLSGKERRGSRQAYNRISEALEELQAYLVSDGDALWDDISGAQSDFLTVLDVYLHQDSSECHMEEEVEDLARILSLRDRHDPVYAGCTGLPTAREER